MARRRQGGRVARGSCLSYALHRPLLLGEVSKCAERRSWKRVKGKRLRRIDSVKTASSSWGGGRSLKSKVQGRRSEVRSSKSKIEAPGKIQTARFKKHGASWLSCLNRKGICLMQVLLI